MISASGGEVARAHSVEELLSSSPEPTAPSDVVPPEGPSSLPVRPQVPSKGPGSKFDWKNFQEAVRDVTKTHLFISVVVQFMFIQFIEQVITFLNWFVFQNQLHFWSAFNLLFTLNFS